MGSKVKRKLGQPVGYRPPDNVKGNAVEEIARWVRKKLNNPEIKLKSLSLAKKEELMLLLEAILKENGNGK